MTTYQQDDNGNWTEATPIGYTAGIDWEVSHERRVLIARAYDPAELLATVRALTTRGLARKMRRTEARLKRGDNA